MVQVRYPQIKQRYVYGITAPVTSDPLLDSEAFSEPDIARIGFHNDCFLASADDYGTYEDYGNTSTPRRSATTTLRDYFSADSKFVVVGGETCGDNFSPQNDCEPSGHAQQELGDMHYSFLNTDYNNAVNNDWNTGGCIEEIKKRLGYRFVLREAELPATVVRGSDLKIKIVGENVGYASPFGLRPLLLILRSNENGDVHKFALEADVRKWFTGEFTIEQTISIPSNLNVGDYEVLISSPDRHSTIADRFEYSIRFGNNDIWEPTTGYNKLKHTITVQ
jgi:hypothetical protein